MRTILLCNSDILAIPAAIRLTNDGFLMAVAIPQKSKKLLMPALVQAGIPQEKIYLIRKETLETDLKSLIFKYQAEVVLALTFPWKIPSSILTLPTKGCVNFHFGLLPVYKGADPVFWQLKNREKNGGITVHMMTGVVDEGPILLEEQMYVIPGETYGIHCQRLGVLAENILVKIFDLLKTGTPVLTTSPPVKALFYNSPNLHDLMINWQQQTADEIECLVNACNPRYGGAITTIRQMQLRFLEVSPADLNTNNILVPPGTIAYADINYGLIVACIKNSFLKINVVNLPEGYLSGIKLFNLGYKSGEIFH